MRPLALKWRLSLLLAVAMATAVGLICVIAYVETRELFHDQTDRSLLALARAADEASNDTADASAASAHLAAILPPPGHRATTIARIWRDDIKQALYVSPPASIDWDAPLASIAKPQKGKSLFFTASFGRGAYRCVWMRPAGGDLSIVVAEATREVDGELGEVLRGLIWTGVSVTVIMFVLVIVLVHWGLRPIHVAAGQLRSVEPRSLAQVQLDPGGVPSELAPFVGSLQQMLQRLDAAMQRQKAFIADASHELRTPMTAAKSTIQATLASPRSADEYRESLDEALEDLRRMESLVEELLLLARLDESQAPLSDQPIQLDQLLTDVAQSFTERIAQSGSKLVCSLCPAVIAGDDRQLARLFSNLLDNAVRHGPRGRDIHLTSQTRAGFVSVTVGDAGGNIPASALPRLFERFFRVDPSRSSSTGGAGLGLAIAKEIALRHGGTIEITSAPETGTRVTVTLPCVEPRPN